MRLPLGLCVCVAMLCQGHAVLEADAAGHRPQGSELQLPLSRVPGGLFEPWAASRAGEGPIPVRPFWLMTRQVRNDEFLAFVREHPRYRRDGIARTFADEQYLAHYQAPLVLGAAARPHQPVTHVSWFAARAFCESQQLRLPTEAEWEWAAAASDTLADARKDPAFRQRILDWYARPVHDLPDVPYGPKNLYGIHDLHGVVWEWVEDFNADIVVDDDRSRQDGSQSRAVCGGGALGARDAEDYPAFLRQGFRSSLQASYTASSLGFRCARDDRARGARGRT